MHTYSRVAYITTNKASPVTVDEHLLAPPEAIPHEAVRHFHAIDLLVVERNGHGERITDSHVLGYKSVIRGAGVDPHVTAGHGRRGCQRCGADKAAVEWRE